MARRKPAIVEAHCNKCGPDTRHQVLKEATIEGEDVAGDGWAYEYEFIQCRGCQVIHMRERFVDPNGDRPWQYFPPAATRHQPAWARKLWLTDTAVSIIMSQTYQALHAGLSVLAVMGARAMLDMALTEAVGDQHGGFTGKLREAKKRELMSTTDVKILEATFDAGSASVHRGFVPPPDIVESVIDIVENVMQRVYVLPEMEKKLKAATPPRKPNPKKGSASSP